VAEGESLRVATATGAITLPVQIGAIVDRVVWLPAHSPGSWISELGVAAGGLVELSPAGALPQQDQAALAATGVDPAAVAGPAEGVRG
jgi:hypothetical protein